MCSSSTCIIKRAIDKAIHTGIACIVRLWYSKVTVVCLQTGSVKSLCFAAFPSYLIRSEAEMIVSDWTSCLTYLKSTFSLLGYLEVDIFVNKTPRAYRAAKRREGMQLQDSEIFIVTKIRSYTHHLSTLRKKGCG